MIFFRILVASSIIAMKSLMLNPKLIVASAVYSLSFYDARRCEIQDGIKFGHRTVFSALGGYANGVVAVSKHCHIHSRSHDIGNLASPWA